MLVICFCFSLEEDTTPEIVFSYWATEDYQLGDLSAQSWLDLSVRYGVNRGRGRGGGTLAIYTWGSGDVPCKRVFLVNFP